jgi:hypothetical protein
MSSYWETLRPSSNCVHFIYDAALSAMDSLTDAMRDAGVCHFYVDYEMVKAKNAHIANEIAQSLGLDNVPYTEQVAQYQPELWLPFLDDLITLSERSSGIAIIIDRADKLLADDSRGMFRLIEVFLTQVHHWLEKGKACHLCFQMTVDDVVGRIFM